MSNIVSFHEAAANACIAVGERLGGTLASMIMQQVMLRGWGPEEVEIAVNQAMAEVRQFLTDGGACRNDVEVMSQLIYASLIKRGKEIAINSDWEGGQA